MAQPRKITFFFDCISPYSAFAWVALLRLRVPWNLQIEIKPFFLGGIMKGSGNQPPAMLPSRAKFIAQDVERNCELFDLPVLPTPNNFFSSVARDILKVQRCIAGCIVDGTPTSQVESIVTAFFNGVHVDPSQRTENNDLNINDAFILSCLKAAGLTATAAAKALKSSQSEAAKKLLNDNSNESLELGAYGSPTMLIHFGTPYEKSGGQPWLVFGSDRFEQIALLGKLPYPGVGPKPSKL